MPPKGYKSVSISKTLLDEIEALLAQLKDDLDVQPYTNVTAFVVDAVRRRTEELRRIYFLGEE